MSWGIGKQVPAIRLQNGSRRWISHHVLQENKLLTKTVEINVTNTILASLNATITEGAGARAEGSRSSAVTTNQEGTPHLLVEDHRVPPSDCPGEADHDVVGTTVPFPKGCKELRVLACFRGKEAWVPYRNKVYPRKLRTIHVITAVDKQLDGYHVYGQDHEVCSTTRHWLSCTSSVDANDRRNNISASVNDDQIPSRQVFFLTVGG